MPDFITENCKDMFKKILIPDPAKRANVSDIKKLPWFNLYQNTEKPAY